VGGNLPPPGRGVVAGTGRREQHLGRRDAELQHQRAVAVVGVVPVVAGRSEPRGHQHGLVAGAADLEVDPVLALELDLLVVDAPDTYMVR
jgi:hypothetical protein